MHKKLRRQADLTPILLTLDPSVSDAYSRVAEALHLDTVTLLRHLLVASVPTLEQLAEAIETSTSALLRDALCVHMEVACGDVVVGGDARCVLGSLSRMVAPVPEARTTRDRLYRAS